MSNLTPDEDYEHVNANIMEDQLEVAIRALHVIAAMPSSDPEFLSSVAIDALREMETYGMMWHDDIY
jgi:hypothetical protein|tara:strand:- start:12510 stop:12710 length:201 start_codon:yes stop_codon:yes gene_type:complete